MEYILALDQQMLELAICFKCLVYNIMQRIFLL